MNRLLITFLTLVSVSGWSFTAAAQSYNVCGNLKYWDSRTDRDADSNLPGLGGTNNPARRVKLYLYDQDGPCRDFDPVCGNDGDDDLLAIVYSNASDGDFCFNSIAWDNDVYFVTRFESDDHHLFDDSGTKPLAFSKTYWNFGTSGNLNTDWNITCPDANLVDVDGWCDDQGLVDAAFADLEPFGNILDSAVDVDWVVSDDSLFHSNGHGGPIEIYYPEDPGADCDGSNSETLEDCDGLCIGAGQDDDNHIVAHEIGHVLHKRQLDVCSGVTSCTSSVSWTNSHADKCATAEGWAEFVAAATYWPRGETAGWLRVEARNLEGNTTQGNSGVNTVCVSIASSPAGVRGNVARFFWDIYDTSSTQDGWGGYVDNSAVSFDSLLEYWTDFGAGTANGEASESGSDGRNVWDYNDKASGAFEEEIGLNCLLGQDDTGY